MYLKSLFGLTVFSVALCCVWLFQVYFLSVNVVFYSALVAAAVALFTQALFVNYIGLFGDFSRFEKVQHLLICGLTGYVLAISVPTVIDRSLSFYILEKLQQRGGAIRQDQFINVFTIEYLNEHRLIDIRLTEQSESGTLTISNNCVRITPKGDRIAAFSRFFRRNFLPKKRLIMGEYTDQLTDPFRNAGGNLDYDCP